MITENKDFICNWNISKFSHEAMKTVFHVFIAKEDEDYAEKAAYEAFKEIDILEDNLSRYRPNSDISKINNLQPGESVIVNEDTLNCLIKSNEMYDLTNGIFDISLGRSIQNWKDNENQNEINSSSKMQAILIDPTNYSVIVSDRVTLDLGGIGKGYAASKIEELFLDWELKDYMISCGNSTVKVGKTNTKIPWPITLTNPKTNVIISELNLVSGSLSSSGLLKGNHIINPNDLQPVKNDRLCCWVYCADPTKSDALSTAFMILDEEKINHISSEDDSLSYAIIMEIEGDSKILKSGSFF